MWTTIGVDWLTLVCFIPKLDYMYNQIWDKLHGRRDRTFAAWLVPVAFVTVPRFFTAGAILHLHNGNSSDGRPLRSCALSIKKNYFLLRHCNVFKNQRTTCTSIKCLQVRRSYTTVCELEYVCMCSQCDNGGLCLHTRAVDSWLQLHSRNLLLLSYYHSLAVPAKSSRGFNRNTLRNLIRRFFMWRHDVTCNLCSNIT